MSWMVEYDQLDDDQRDFVDNKINDPGNLWIKGFAGSGKSILLVHALRKKLLDQPNAKTCIIVYTHSLIEMFKMGINEIDPENKIGLQNVPIMTYFQFQNGNDHFDYIFCDEVQDLPEHVLTEMRRRASYVHVAGDSNQSIYEDTVSPQDIGRVLNANPFTLTRIHRLTQRIIRIVNTLLPNMGIFQGLNNMVVDDVDVRLIQANDRDEEIEYTFEQAKEATDEGYSAAILLPTHNDIIDCTNRLLQLNGKSNWNVQNNQYGRPEYSSLNAHFKAQSMKVEYVGNAYGSFTNATRNRNIVLMTYHSSKGMDFENVFIPYLSSDLFIVDTTLFMVALTRSKINLYLSYSDYLHPYVENFRNQCTVIKPGNNENQNSGADFDF